MTIKELAEDAVNKALREVRINQAIEKLLLGREEKLIADSPQEYKGFLEGLADKLSLGFDWVEENYQHELEHMQGGKWFCQENQIDDHDFNYFFAINLEKTAIGGLDITCQCHCIYPEGRVDNEKFQRAFLAGPKSLSWKDKEKLNLLNR